MGLFGTKTIERFLHTSYDQFAGAGTIVKFLPLIAELFARQRLRALAKIEGLHDDGRPTVLFLCTQNAGRIEAMAERGMDISDEFPRPWTDETVRAADVVITMGCGDACPVFPGKQYQDWDVTDPTGLDVAGIRPIRDEIERRVRELLAYLDLASKYYPSLAIGSRSCPRRGELRRRSSPLWRPVRSKTPASAVHSRRRRPARRSRPV